MINQKNHTLAMVFIVLLGLGGCRSVENGTSPADDSNSEQRKENPWRLPPKDSWWEANQNKEWEEYEKKESKPPTNKGHAVFRWLEKVEGRPSTSPPSRYQTPSIDTKSRPLSVGIR